MINTTVACQNRDNYEVHPATKTNTIRMILEIEARALNCVSRSVSRAASFARAALLLASLAVATSHAITGFSVRSDTDKKLFSINLLTGAATELGATGFADVEALAMNATGELFGVNPTTAQLIKCAPATGACTAVGTMNDVPSSPLANAGLAFAANGKLYLAINALIYAVDPNTAATAVMGPSGAAISGLASGKVSAACSTGLYAVGGNSDQGKLYCIDSATGSAKQLGSLTSGTSLDGGLDADATTGRLWGISNGATSQIYSVDPSTLAVAHVKAVTLNGVAVGGFESLAVKRSVASSAHNGAHEVSAVSHWGWLAALIFMFAATAQRAARRPR